MVYRIRLLAVAVCLLLTGQVVAADLAVTAVASLIAPAKLATLQGERAANRRVLKCVYWLNDPVLAVSSRKRLSIRPRR
ncbi:MAG: hypothetical protein M3Q46_10135 [Verrucomicrobiota bacterium]|nr:hypothetical protein [Verrucomicrobiota bacterium]